MKQSIKYKKEYCKKILDYFNIPHTVEKNEITTDKNGEKVKTVEKANILPTFEKFAVKIGTTSQTLNDWCKKHEEFNIAYNQCKTLQKEMLNDLAMRGFYNPTYTIFVAKNITDMTDKPDTQNTDFEEIRQSYLSAMNNLGKI